MRPACYQDLLDGKTLFQKMQGKFVEIVPGSGKHCSTIAGDTYHMGWSWKGYSLGGSTGHLHKRQFTDANHYRRETQSEPRLFVDVAPELIEAPPL